MHRRLRRLLLLSVLALAGCTTPTATIGPAPAAQQSDPAPTPPPPLEFRLAHPIGKHVLTRARDPFTVTIGHCDGALSQAPQVYAETLPLPQRFQIGDGRDGSSPDAEAAVAAAAVRRFYDLGHDNARSVRGEVTLEAAANTRAVYTLRWVETWDRNELQALSDGRVVTTWALTVLTSAQLLSESVSIAECLPGVAGATAASPGALGASEDTAEGFVLGYIALLDARDYRGAYALLAPEYQERVPYHHYVEGYAPVLSLEARSLSSEVTAEGFAVVRAALVLALQRQGTRVTSPWQATYWLDRRPGDGGETWRLVGVEMIPATP